MYESERPTAKYLIFDFTSENQFLGKIIPVEKSQWALILILIKLLFIP